MKISNVKKKMAKLSVAIFAFVLMADFSLAASTTVEFTNPLKYTTVEGFLTSMLGVLQGLVAVVAIVFIVIGGFYYLTAGVNEKNIETGKKAITAALIGLSITLVAPSLIQQIYSILGADEMPSEVSGAKSLASIMTGVLDFLLGIAGILAIIMMVYGGLMYFAAAADEKKAETGKKIVTWSVIGVVVVLGSLLLVSQIAGFFS